MKLSKLNRDYGVRSGLYNLSFPLCQRQGKTFKGFEKLEKLA